MKSIETTLISLTFIGIFSVSKEKNSKSSQDEHKLSNFDSASSGGPPGGGGGTMGKEKVKGQMERRLSLISGIALIVGTMIGTSLLIRVRILFARLKFWFFIINNEILVIFDIGLLNISYWHVTCHINNHKTKVK